MRLAPSQCSPAVLSRAVELCCTVLCFCRAVSVVRSRSGFALKRSFRARADHAVLTQSLSVSCSQVAESSGAGSESGGSRRRAARTRAQLQSLVECPDCCGLVDSRRQQALHAILQPRKPFGKFIVCLSMSLSEKEQGFRDIDVSVCSREWAGQTRNFRCPSLTRVSCVRGGGKSLWDPHATNVSSTAS